MAPFSYPVACIVQAQAEATPFCNSALAALGDLPALAYVLRRCQAIPGVDDMMCIAQLIAREPELTLVNEVSRQR